jgi:hypothetical protein
MSQSSAAWTRIATIEGASVVALVTATNADGDDVLYAATALGVHRSDDGGDTWNRLGRLGEVQLVAALAPAVTHVADGRVYAGWALGLSVWDPSSGTWHHVLADANVTAVAAARDADGLERVMVGTTRDGMLVSRDGGATWEGVNSGLLDLGVTAIAVSADFERDGIALVASRFGVHRSRNWGDSWRLVGKEWRGIAVQALGLAPEPGRQRLALAGSDESGLFRSRSGGNGWEPIEDFPWMCVNDIDVAPGGVAAVATSDGVAISTDDGSTWRLSGESQFPALALARVTHHGERAIVAAALSRGIVISNDEGKSWRQAARSPRPQLITRLIPSPAFASDNTLFAAGFEVGLLASTDGGRTWVSLTTVETTAVLDLAISPEHAADGMVIIATPEGGFVRTSQNPGWEPLLSDPTSVPVLVRVAPDAPNKRIFAVLSDGWVVQSIDDGHTWGTIDAPWGDEGVTAMVTSPGYMHDKTLVALTCPMGDARPRHSVWVSINHGSSWRRLADFASDFQPIVDIAVDGDARPVIILADGAQLTRFDVDLEAASGPPRTTTITTADGWLTTCLAVSPEFARDQTLYVGSRLGVVVSRDGGATFQDQSSGLESSAVVGLAISPEFGSDRRLWGLTVGAGVWECIDRDVDRSVPLP